MLSLIRLDMLNFKAYRGETSISLANAPGLYYVKGVNNVAPDLSPGGAGKSTLFDAISWIVYEKTLRDKRPGASIETWGQSGKTLGTLTYQHADVLTRITRGRRPNLLQYATKAVGVGWSEPITCDQKTVERIFPLSFEAFRCTLVLPQFGKLFLDMPPEEQSQLFSEFLDLDVWLRASDDAAALARATNTELVEHERTLAAVNGRIDEIDHAIEQTEVAASAFKAEIAREVKVKRSLLHETTSRLASRKQSKRPLDRDVQAAAVVVEKLRNEDRECYSKLAAVVKRTEAGASAIEALVQQRDFYKSRPLECVACGQKVPEAHYKKMLKVCDGAILEAQEVSRKTWDEKVAADKALQSVKARLDEAMSAYNAAQRGYNNLLQTWTTFTEQTREIERTRDRLRQEIADLPERVNPYAKDLQRLGQRFTQALDECERLSAQIDEAKWSASTYTFWVDAYRKIRLSLIDEVLGALEQAANTNAEELGIHGWALTLATERETAAGKLSQGFTCLLYPPGQEDAVRWQAYCGNEVQRWQLAMRFALSELLLAYAGVEPNIEVLDEPTQHLTPAGIDSLLLCLRERAKRLNRQIWLVDHHALGMDMFDGSITVIHNVDGVQVVFA